jgi:hypothetical protein
VPEQEAQPAGGRVLAHPAFERLDHARPGAPGQVEPRHRVAVPVGPAVAPLGPADDREEPQTHRPQPRALLAGREVDVRLGPPARPVVLLAVELGASHPVRQGEVVAVVHPHPALLRGVDEEQAAEAPEGLPTQRLLGLLVDQEHPSPGVGDFRGGGEPGQAVTDDDDIGIRGGVHGRTLTARTRLGSGS